MRALTAQYMFERLLKHNVTVTLPGHRTGRQHRSSMNHTVWPCQSDMLCAELLDANDTTAGEHAWRKCDIMEAARWPRHPAHAARQPSGWLKPYTVSPLQSALLQHLRAHLFTSMWRHMFWTASIRSWHARQQSLRCLAALHCPKHVRLTGTSITCPPS